MGKAMVNGVRLSDFEKDDSLCIMVCAGVSRDRGCRLDQIHLSVTVNV